MIVPMTRYSVLVFHRDFATFMEKLQQEGLLDIRQNEVHTPQADTEFYPILQRIEKVQRAFKLEAKELKEAAPKVQYYDAAMASMGTYSATAIAKDLGMSAKELNKRLYAIGVQFKNGETWYPYAKYQDKGYTRIVPKYITTKEGEEINKPSMRWTEKGRKFILQLRSEGRI